MAAKLDEFKPLLLSQVNIQVDDEDTCKGVTTFPAENHISTADIQDRLTSHNIKEYEKSDHRAMGTFRRVLDDCEIIQGTKTTSTDIRLLVVGRTGEGKSNLINSIIDLGKTVAEERADTDCCTSDTVQQYFYSDLVPGVNVTLIDSPGLQDIHQKEQSYIQSMKSECQEVSLVLYCWKMTDHRFTNDDKLVMQKLHQAFGPKFWKRVVFVLTFANKEDCNRGDSRDKPSTSDPKERFTDRIQHRAKKVHELLKKQLQVSVNIVFVPAGDARQPGQFQPLPDREDWLYDLLKFCCLQIKNDHEFINFNLNDKIHLAFIIDNDGDVADGADVATDEECQPAHDDISSVGNVARQATNSSAHQATQIREAFKTLGFCVLFLDSLNSKSIDRLLKAFKKVNHAELASFALIILSKGKTHHVYDVNNDCILFENLFSYFETSDNIIMASVPKLFFFHLALKKRPKNELAIDVKSLPKNSIALITSVLNLNESTSSPVINTFARTLNSSRPLKQCLQKVHDEVQGMCLSVKLTNNLTDEYVLPTPYVPPNDRQERIYKKRKWHLCHAMWYPIRCQTVDVLLGSKDEVLTILRAERITKIAACTTSLVVGGGLAAAGVALIPFTFGASIGLSVAGGAIGIAGSASGLAATISSKVMSSRHLKIAQQHIHLDQQLSRRVNEIADEYELIKQASLKYAGEVAASGLQAAAGVGRIGVGVAVGLEGAVEGGIIAFRAAGHAIGTALAGASLAVSVPIDIAFIAYNSYLVHTSKGGISDKSQVIQWFVKQTEEMLKGTFTTIGTTKGYGRRPRSRRVTEAESFDVTACIDYKHNMYNGFSARHLTPVFSREDCILAVSTILSGTFRLPENAILVSAVYNIQSVTGEKLIPAVDIEIEHCVKVLNDQPTAEEMKFATATLDVNEKAFVFTPLEDGTFLENETHGSISISDSCLLCILYLGDESQQDHSLIKYAAQCSYTKEFKNYWKMDVTFTKSLSAHHMYVQDETVLDVKSCPFKFNKPSSENNSSCIQFEHSIIREKGWIIHESPDSAQNIQDKIFKKTLDAVGQQSYDNPHSKRIFPSITLDIQVENEKESNELKTTIEVTGTDLKLEITRPKEQ